MIDLKLLGENGEVKLSATGERIDVIYGAEYVSGDRWLITTEEDSFLKIKLDATLSDSVVYLPEGKMEFKIPFDLERRSCYAPEAFSGDNKRIGIGIPTDDEIYGEREISFNPHARHMVHSYYPYAWANSVTNEHPSLFARNTIDGVIRNERHGIYPHHSWGGGKREDLEFSVNFGRTAEISSVELFLRADFPHDTYWTDAALEFSDGSKKHIELRGITDGQKFEFEPVKTDLLKIVDFKQKRLDDGSLSFAALSQIRVVGKYLKNG